MKYLKCVFVIIMFALILFATYWAHIKFFKINVVFYSAMIDALIATAITGVMIGAIKWFQIFNMFESVYAKEYMKEHRLVDVRLTEQEQSGTIVIKDGCVKLTEWGNKLATMSRYFRTYFLPQQRLLMGEYSSDLTSPFKASDSSVSYVYY